MTQVDAIFPLFLVWLQDPTAFSRIIRPIFSASDCSRGYSRGLSERCWLHQRLFGYIPQE
jgi:hypothetical protein